MHFAFVKWYSLLQFYLMTTNEMLCRTLFIYMDVNNKKKKINGRQYAFFRSNNMNNQILYKSGFHFYIQY